MLLFFFLGIVHSGFSQEDSISVNEPSFPQSDGFVLKPTFGLGVGNFTFMGDVANSHKGFHPNVSRIGYELRVSNPLTDYLDIAFYVVFGTVSANERTSSRNLNFQSQIRTGGAVLSYNFLQILPENRKIEPYLFTGLESFEFLSKTDLFDANGNRYYYWSDGSIRNIDESSPNAAYAIMLNRDYHYETDIRESNLDGFGKYRERSWAVPIGIGANMRLNDHWNFRVGTSLHFTFTDLVDGVSEESVGDRQGNSANDKFLFTSFTVNYDLLPLGEKKPKRPDEIDPEMENWLAKDTVDSDSDGIVDFIDDCAFTPKGLEVDAKGCPLDKDKDFVFDYRDDELPTPEGNQVDRKGVTLSDESIEKSFLRYIDSTGAYVEYALNKEVTEFTLDGMRKPSSKVNKNQYYVLILGKEKKSVTGNELHKYLSFQDFKTVESGDTVYYILGNYGSLADVIDRKEEIEKQGVKVEGVGKASDGTDGNNQTVTNIQTVTQQEIDKVQNNGNMVQNDKRTMYRVQIGAYKKKLSKNVFKDVPDLLEVTGSDGITRYYSGAFEDKSKAAERRVELMTKGYEGAFITAFKEGDRLNLEKAGIEFVEGVDPTTYDEKNDFNNQGIKKENIKFRIQVGAYKNDVPTEVLDIFLEIGNILPKRGEDGVTRYVTKTFSSYEEAWSDKNEIHFMGITDAFVVGEVNGRIVTYQEALELLKN